MVEEDEDKRNIKNKGEGEESSESKKKSENEVPAGHPPVSGGKGQCPFLAGQSKKQVKEKTDWLFMASAFVLLFSMVFGGIQYAKSEVDWRDVVAYFKDEVASSSIMRNTTVGPEPGVSISSPDAVPDYPVSFTVHFNGDGLSKGVAINSADYRSIDPIIISTCEKFIKEYNDEIIKRSQCQPNNGARLYAENGVRIYSFLDIKPGSRTYIVPQGVLFVYPLGEVGSVIIPGTVEEVIPGKPVTLTQVTQNPRVFTVENFMTKEEMEKIISHNEHLVKPSEVGFSGWRDSTRTSQTSWDFTSWAAKKVLKRSFDLTAMSFDKHMADAVQVLRYGNNEWYKPHCDWFDEKGYEGHDPTINNGTNRFATVFLYLTDVEAGGETVFPLSTTHEGYNGEQLVHKGTEKTAGYIADKDAKWVCNSSSTALRTKPKAGSAVLFYSQGPRGELDKFSLHGGCPVIEGTKWSANVWLWNRPKPSKSNAKADDKKRGEDYRKGKNIHNENEIRVTMMNTFDEAIDVFWDDGSEEMVYQMQIDVGAGNPMTTYNGHHFVVKSAATKQRLGSYRADPKDNHDEITFQ